MNVSSKSSERSQPFARILGVIALIAAALYFVGWIYKSSYFSFFYIDITTLNLPVDSYYWSSYSVLLGSPKSIARTVLGSLCLGGLIVLFSAIKQRMPFNYNKLNFLPKNSRTVNLLRLIFGFAEEGIVVILILYALFAMAKSQAISDARRDVVNATSTLPAVTILFLEDETALGRNIDAPLRNPSELRILGDQDVYRNILGNELTNTNHSDTPRVWRLLLMRGEYAYVFPALPKKDPNISVPVVMTKGNILTILSPK